MRTCLAQIFTLLLSVTSTCLLHVSKAQSVQFAPEAEGETFRNLISAHSHLLLGSNRAIYRLNDDLVRQQKRTLTGPSRMLVADYVGSFRNSFLSCDNITCFLAQLTDFESVSWQVNSPLVRRFQDNAVGVLAPRANGTSDLTYGERAGKQLGGGRLFAKGSLYNAGVSNAPYSFLQYARREETNRFDPLVYLTEFPLRFTSNDSGFVYFITHPTQNEIRVVRFCEDDGGVLGSFTSHFEAVLQCGSTSGFFANDSTSATFINITSTFNDRPTILVTQARVTAMNVQLEVCSFDIGNINFLMTQKYDDCVTAQNDAMAGFFRDGQALCSVVDGNVLQNVNECFLPGTARPGLEVLNPYVEQPLSMLAVNSVTTSIAHTTLDGALFLFAATTSGELIQFHISSPTQAAHVRTVSIPVMSFENVTKMVSSDSGEHIVAMTPSRVFRHSVDMCHTFASCTDCLTSGDPICGWCPLSGSCARQSNCPSVQPVSDPIWLTNVNTCPTISTINPSVVYIPQLMQQTVEFTMSTMNIASTPLTSYTYSCLFNFQNADSAPVMTPATQTNGQFMCDSPTGSQVPQLASGQDTLDTMVSLVVAGSGVSVVSLEMFFPFTDCRVHDSCTSCIGDSRCEWCPFSFKCVQPGTTCAADSSEPTITNGGVCPQIFPSSMTGEYLIHADHTYSDIPLRINSSDLSQFRNDFDNGRFRCEICSQSDVSCDTPLFSSQAQLSQSGNEVLCQQERYDAVDNSPSLSARLRVVWNSQRTIDNPNDASVILYSCSLMGTNCGQCLAQEPRFECSYCYNPTTTNGDCLLKVTCSTDSGLLSFMNTTDVRYCPRPQILDFEPKAGPTKGGTAVTIVGTNLGARREDVANVMIDGVSCNVMGYEPGVSITCVTGVNHGSITSDIVSVYFNHVDGRVDSEDTFMFATPFLNSPPADPRRGPRSGGTNITIRGTDIGIGSCHHVLVGQRVCVVTEVRTDSIMCTTPSTNSMSNELQLVQLSVDNWTSELPGFQYVDDPTFQSIVPNVIFESGGMNYTISGDNLNSVQEARLLIYYGEVATVSRRHFQSEPCILESTSRMFCTAPSLSGVHYTQPSHQLRIGLLMDGVTSLLVLQNTSLTLFPDPMFQTFMEEIEFITGSPIALTIQGSGFFFTREQVRIQINPCSSEQPEECQCHVTNVLPNNNTLYCIIDTISQFILERSQPLTLTAVIGNQMEQFGTIRISDAVREFNTNDLQFLYYLIPILFVAIISIGTVICILVVIGVFQCQKVQQRNHINREEVFELEQNDSYGTTHEIKISSEEVWIQNRLKLLSPELHISSDQLRVFKKVIGQGEFGVVYKAKLTRCQDSPQIVAIKTLKGLFKAEEDVEGMLSEIEKMKEFDHPNVMSLIGVCLDAGPGVSIVMPFMANGSLLDYLRKERDNIHVTQDSELDVILSARKLLLRMCNQIAKGMEYLALQKFVHRDLAARNCMLDYHGNVIVGDFGLTEDVYVKGYFRQDKSDAVKLPSKWMAPESLRDGLFSEKSDVWSFGVTCWEVFSTGRIPYPTVDVRTILKYIEDGSRLEKPSNAACSPEVFSVVIKCWTLNPKNRPTFAALCSSFEKLLKAVAGYQELEMQLLPEDDNITYHDR